jgi:hypothetical protein
VWVGGLASLGLLHRPLFRVTQYALKSFDQYNLTIGPSCLLGNPFQPILEPSLQYALKIPTSCLLRNPLSCYTVCTQKFRSIQFDLRGLMFPQEPLSAYFETRPTSFHDHFLQFISRIVDNFVFLVAIFCARHLRTSFQVYEISI